MSMICHEGYNQPVTLRGTVTLKNAHIKKIFELLFKAIFKKGTYRISTQRAL